MGTDDRWGGRLGGIWGGSPGARLLSGEGRREVSTGAHSDAPLPESAHPGNAALIESRLVSTREGHVGGAGEVS